MRRFRDKHPVGLTPVYAGLLLILWVTGCGPAVYEYASADEAAEHIPYLPIYGVENGLDRGMIEAVYRYYDLQDQFIVTTTFFAPDGNEHSVQVGYLRVATVSSPAGIANPWDRESQTFDYQNVYLGEPFDISATTCRVTADVNEDIQGNGPEYVTCLWWYDDNHRLHQFYAIWPLDETATFLETLVLIE